ncbi:MAG TPA: 2,3,4,5-tetrahydropyridine-2,6-dicarboxylate N-succinyltransferase, partial [Thermoanaerobaculia bacterium]|nr:2,3,4,5-tetrahydropyridine-2,6-dicarboxylate N-succinyltransferase [Thermoanaerobaculia bacterium]
MPAEGLAALRQEIERLFNEPPAAYGPEHRVTFDLFKGVLNRGEIRAAEPDPGSPTGWRVNPWVKQGILVGFRMGEVVDMSVGGPDGGRLPFLDKSTYPPRPLGLQDGVRLVPGGSAIRDGCYLGRGVICMPPMYVNVGAWVDDGSLVDSHALVGSCAQVGKRVHLSAAAQLGGVLEPVGASPVIVEDDVLIGGNCGVYEGTVVKRRAVLGAGTILTRSTPVYDLIRETIHRGTEDQPLVIP